MTWPHPHSSVFAVIAPAFAISPECWRSTLATGAVFREHNIPYAFSDVSGEESLYLANNKAATCFIEDGNFENLFLINSLVGWSAERALELAEREQSVVLGICPRRDDSIEFPVEFELDAQGLPISRGDLLLVRAIKRSGFLRVKRAALRKLAEHSGIFYDEISRRDKVRSYYEFFAPCAGQDGRYWREEAAFVQRCREMDIEVWADPACMLAWQETSLLRARLSDYVKTEE